MKQQFWSTFECGCRMPSEQGRKSPGGWVCPKHRKPVKIREVVCPVCGGMIQISRNRNRLSACDACKTKTLENTSVFYIFKCGCKGIKCARGRCNVPLCPEHKAGLVGKEGRCACGVVETLKMNHNNWKRCRVCQAEQDKKSTRKARDKNPKPKVHYQGEPVEPPRVLYDPFGAIPAVYLAGILDGDAVVYTAMSSSPV